MPSVGQHLPCRQAFNIGRMDAISSRDEIDLNEHAQVIKERWQHGRSRHSLV